MNQGKRNNGNGGQNGEQRAKPAQPPVQQPARKKPGPTKPLTRFRKHPFLGLALFASLLAVIYWGVIASPRFVSEAHIIIQHAEVSAGSGDFRGLIGEMGSVSRNEQLLLQDHLLSVDMLKKLDEKLNLRAHYSQIGKDPLSRMWFEDASMERFHRHYQSRVAVEYDDYTGILIVKAQAYDAKTANAIANMLVKDGERFMNAMANGLAEGQIAFLERQVSDASKRAIDARQKMLEFQNKKGLASPQGTAENYAAIISRLEGQLAELQTRRSTLLGYLMPNSPNVVEVNQQIAAVEKQIEREKSRLATPYGNALNTTVEEYQRLQLNADFQQDVYKTALATLEKGRMDATRMLKKVSVVQSPSMPQYPIEPRRLYNITVFILAALIIAGILHLLAAIIRDHKD